MALQMKKASGGIRSAVRGRSPAIALVGKMTAFVRIRPLPGHLPKISALAQQIPEVVECHRVTGEDCFILKVHLPEIASLDRVLDRFLVHGQTTTSIVQSSPVPPRSPQLLMAPARKSRKHARTVVGTDRRAVR